MNKTINIARGGLFTALTVLLLYITDITPTSKLTLMTIVSAIIPYSILTTGIKNSFVVYGAASFLSFFLVNEKGVVITYAVFFGLYGFVKYYVESLSKVVYEIIIKLVYFNISLFIMYKLYVVVFTSTITTKLPTYAVIAGAQVAFFLYDYALTGIIAYIRKRFIKN